MRKAVTEAMAAFSGRNDWRHARKVLLCAALNVGPKPLETQSSVPNAETRSLSRRRRNDHPQQQRYL